jgi:WD40 repeat protein
MYVQKRRLPATFSFNEDYVLAPDESAAVAIIWDTRSGAPSLSPVRACAVARPQVSDSLKHSSGDLLQRLTGHNQLLRYLASSPVENALVTCSDDSRARFWMV